MKGSRRYPFCRIRIWDGKPKKKKKNRRARANVKRGRDLSGGRGGGEEGEVKEHEGEHESLRQDVAQAGGGSSSSRWRPHMQSLPLLRALCTRVTSAVAITP